MFNMFCLQNCYGEHKLYGNDTLLTLGCIDSQVYIYMYTSTSKCVEFAQNLEIKGLQAFVSGICCTYVKWVCIHPLNLTSLNIDFCLFRDYIMIPK